MPTVKQLYRNFLQLHTFCWACGRDNSYRSIPAGWYGYWKIERAHIVWHPRVEDRRVIAALCALCHAQQHRRRIATACRPLDWPPLELPHLLWLKFKNDMLFYDRKFLQRHHIRMLPRAVKPPACYLEEFQRRRAA